MNKNNDDKCPENQEFQLFFDNIDYWNSTMLYFYRSPNPSLSQFEFFNLQKNFKFKQELKFWMHNNTTYKVIKLVSGTIPSFSLLYRVPLELRNDKNARYVLIVKGCEKSFIETAMRLDLKRHQEDPYVPGQLDLDKELYQLYTPYILEEKDQKYLFSSQEIKEQPPVSFVEGVKPIPTLVFEKQSEGVIFLNNAFFLGIIIPLGVNFLFDFLKKNKNNKIIGRLVSLLCFAKKKK